MFAVVWLSGRFSRGRALGVSALRTCALLLIGLSGTVAHAQDKAPTAIVIGAGVAGLSAAYELQNKGWQVTLLEAQNTVGGRSGMASSEWIGDAKAQPVLNSYIERFKVPTQPAPEFVRSPGYLIDGQYFGEDDLAQKQPEVAQAFKRYQKALDDLSATLKDPADPTATNDLYAMDQQSVATWLDKLQLPPTARQLLNQRIRTRYDEPSRLSLLYLVQQNRVYRDISDRDLRASRVLGGSQLLAQAFLKQLKSVKTNARVSAISQDAKSVTVKVGSVGYEADYVVLAVPLRALGNIQVTPALDPVRVSAIKGTNYGWHDQVLLKFRAPVWDSQARMSGEIFSNAGLGMLWIEPAPKGAANVVINISGDNARVMQAFGDKQIADQVLIRLQAFYPKARGAFSGYELRRYSTDPSTGGSYLAFGPGQMSRFWRVWERPQQRIAFAGEHTDTLYPGTLEGALRSGQRAASQVQDLAAGKSFDPVKIAPKPAPAAAPVEEDNGGFFSHLFGSSKPKPVAPTPPPVPAAPPVFVPPIPAIVPVPALPAAPAEPNKPATPAKAKPAVKAVKKAAPKAPVKAPAKSIPAKKPAAKPAQPAAAAPAAVPAQ